MNYSDRSLEAQQSFKGKPRNLQEAVAHSLERGNLALSRRAGIRKEDQNRQLGP